MLPFKIVFGILVLFFGCFSVSSLGLELAHMHRYKLRDSLVQLGQLFFYRNILGCFFGTGFLPLAFNLLISAHILRGACIACISVYCIDAIPVWSFVLKISMIMIGLEVLWDVIPRWLTGISSGKLTKYLAFPSSLILTIIAPVSFFLTWLFLRKRRPMRDKSEAFREKMLDMIHENENELDDPTQKTLLQGVLNYQDRIVREVMIPRVKVVALPEKVTVQEAVDTWLSEGYTRTPLFRNSIDHVTGILMSQDLFSAVLASKKNPEILNDPVSSLAKKPFFIPETIALGKMLQEFRIRQAHLAVVVDEFGGTSGVITIEDVLEELVGNINDEYDEEEEDLVRLCSDGSYSVDAKINLYEIEQRLGILIPRHGDYESLNGYIFFATGDIPGVGICIPHENFDIEILSRNERTVELVKVHIHENNTPLH